MSSASMTAIFILMIVVGGPLLLTLFAILLRSDVGREVAATLRARREAMEVGYPPAYDQLAHIEAMLTDIQARLDRLEGKPETPTYMEEGS